MKPINLDNEKFGHLTTISCTKLNGKRAYNCKCDCGAVIIRTVSQLRAGSTYQSCGCKSYEVYEKLYNFVGQTFGDLIVIERLGSHRSSKSVLYKCQCKLCSKEFELTSKSLYRKKNLNCGCVGMPGKRLPNNQGITNKLIQSYKSNAKKRNLQFLLSYEDCKILFSNNCYYCGVEPKQIFKHQKCFGTIVYNGIDRLNNSIGYSIDNSVSCCKTCNYKKRETDMELFLEWVEKIYNNRIKPKEDNKLL